METTTQKETPNVLKERNKLYLDKSYSEKRRILREYSIKPEINDAVCKLVDDIIIGKSSLIPMHKKLGTRLDKEYSDIFNKLFDIIGFSDNITAWNTMKDLLIDGYLALEIIWDDKKENIIGFNRLNPASLSPTYDKAIGNMWIQYPDDKQLRRILLESQIIFISYSSKYDFNSISYVESLIKTYNLFKISEECAIRNSINNATTYKKFTIPMKGMSKQKAEETVEQLIRNYNEDINLDETTGELKINGHKFINFDKQYYMSESELGKTDVKFIKTNSSNMEELKYFKEKFRITTRIPQDDNETENKIYFEFTNKIKNTFKEILLKPWILQLKVKYPSIENIDNIENSVDIIFNKNPTL